MDDSEKSETTPEKVIHLPAGLPSQSPDEAEEQLGILDNIVPTRGYQMLPMVGLGGSAGSIQAICEFFKGMPPDSGFVFVVVIHLSPTHVSTLPDLIARSTQMEVVSAQAGDQQIKPNHVYVIPPGKYLSSVDGHLKLTDMEPTHGRRMSVDLFFRSLADTHGPHAAAIVLSGADGDGALGIRRIKERGGLTIVQDPKQCTHPAMPQTSIDTGMVDWVLQVPEMPTRLLDYFSREKRLKLPPEEPHPVVAGETDQETSLRDLLGFLRTRIGHDFSCYKRATVLRRIGRRLQVNAIEDLRAYLVFLRTHPGEVGALVQDLLISVTNFFRDRENFAALEQWLPSVFQKKTPKDSIRVWVPACATGEEAYSLAILLLEHAQRMEAPPMVQVFACDLDEQAIQTARAGHYPETIVADVSEERLRRFFVKDTRGYQVRRELRETVLFATHDLLKDAPFSRMDLVSCRNLMIYLNREAQSRVMEIFHFALKPGGLLFLGSSESVDESSPMFRVLDKRHRIYAQQPTTRVLSTVPAGASALRRAIEAHERAEAGPVIHGKRFSHEASVPFDGAFGLQLDRATLADLHFRLVERYGPPSLIVNADREIVHLSESAGKFLRFEGGEPSRSLWRVVNPALRVELRSALFRAMELSAPVSSPGISAEIDGKLSTVDLFVAPAEEIAPGYMLITLTLREPTEGAPPPASEPVVRQLERELDEIKRSLRDTVEQYEASTEELKASNEELQAMNEELRSATEELETSREEMQSINEELTTVNQEMKVKVDELARANSDLQNLMASTSIATVFLDRNLLIKFYTPRGAELFHLIPGDVGRPLAHLKHDLDYPELLADAEQVLRALAPIERQVRDQSRWYLVRLQPYRTLEDRIGGVVLTFVDVTERKLVHEALLESQTRMRLLLESARDFALFSYDRNRRIDSWSAGAQAMFGYSESEIIGESADQLFTAEDRSAGVIEREEKQAAEEGRASSERWYVRRDGSRLFGSGTLLPMRTSDGALRGYLRIMRDRTESKHTEQTLRENVDQLTRFNAVAVDRETRMIELKREINALRARLGESPPYAVDEERQVTEDKP